MRTWRGHTNFVNGVAIVDKEDKGGGGYLVVSGSDDGSTRLWDSRARHSVKTLPLKFQVGAVRQTDRQTDRHTDRQTERS